MNQTRTAIAQQKMQQGTYGAQGDKLDWTFYDTEAIDPNTPILNYRYFTNGVGRPFVYGAAGNKTLADTNMITDGIPQSQNFRVHEISMYILDTYLPNAEFVNLGLDYWESVLSFKIANKDVTWQLGLYEMAGLNLMAGAGGAISTNIQNFVRPVFKLKIPIDLAALTQFEVDLDFDQTPQIYLDNQKIQIALRGVLMRLS